MNGHTPGPWRFDPAGDDRIMAERVCVALVTRGVDADCDRDLTGPTYKANAHLIAAAPDLLAALRAYVDHYGDTLKVARPAIAKAEGLPADADAQRRGGQ